MRLRNRLKGPPETSCAGSEADVETRVMTRAIKVVRVKMGIVRTPIRSRMKSQWRRCVAAVQGIDSQRMRRIAEMPCDRLASATKSCVICRRPAQTATPVPAQAKWDVWEILRLCTDRCRDYVGSRAIMRRRVSVKRCRITSLPEKKTRKPSEAGMVRMSRPSLNRAVKGERHRLQHVLYRGTSGKWDRFNNGAWYPNYPRGAVRVLVAPPPATTRIDAGNEGS